VKTMPCEIQHCTDSTITAPHLAAIQAAQVDTWATNANTLQGPDFSDTSTDDGFHFMFDVKLQLAADRWFAALVSRGQLPLITTLHPCASVFAGCLR
jgi:hypothetical protein